MKDPSIRNPANLSFTDQRLTETDQLCDRFAQELVNGNVPRFEDFLVDAPAAARAEPLAIEIEYRTQRDDVPGPDDYIPRFPDSKASSPACLLATRFTGRALAYQWRQE